MNDWRGGAFKSKSPSFRKKKKRSKIPIVLGLIQDRVCAKGIADT